MVRWLRRRFRFFKERQLFSRRSQAIHAEGHALKSDASPEATSKQAGEHRLKIGLPKGAVVKPLLGGLFMMIAVPDREAQASADPPLLPERRAHMF